RRSSPRKRVDGGLLMSASPWSRALPGVAVAALLCLAAAAPGKRPARPTMPAPPPVAAQCLDFSHTGGGDSPLALTGGAGGLQPLPTGITVVACSLSVNGSYYSTANASV